MFAYSGFRNYASASIISKEPEGINDMVKKSDSFVYKGKKVQLETPGKIKSVQKIMDQI